MRPKLALKTLLRSPVRTILTFILLFAVTFAMFSQVMEYAIANREMKKAVEQYDGALSIQSARAPNSDASNPQYMYADSRVSVDELPQFFAEGFRHLKSIPLSDYVMEQVSALPYISYIDKRYMTAGYSDTYTRLDDGRDYYNYTNQCVIEATVAYKYVERITVQDVELLGGRPKRWFDEEGTFIWVEKTKDFRMSAEADAIWRYEVAVKEARTSGGYVPEFEEYLADFFGKYIYYYNPCAERAATFVTENSKYGMEYLENIEVGKRYIFILRYDNYAINFVDTESYYLTDPFVSEYCEAVIPVDGLPENYLESEEFAGVSKYIERVDRNLHTFDMVYTQNTSCIRYFADKTVGISEGRGIEREDTENKNNVCVIHHDMAQAYELKVGDTITVKLGDKLFEQYASKGAIDVSPAQAPENLTEVTLEIVGIFKDTRSDDILTTDPCWSYSINTIFVPQHLLNVSKEELANHKFTPAEVSFIIDDAWDITAFEDECIPQIKDMKLKPFFSDNGWTSLIEGYRETQRLTFIKLAVLTASIFVATCFVSFLYIVGKRHDYAIMRVLGTTKKKSGNALLLPLLVLALIAVAAGSTAAIIYTQQTIAASDSIEFLSGIVSVDTTIPPVAVAACVVGEIALTMLIAQLMLAIIGRNSPLALIQAQVVKQRKRDARKNKKKKEEIPESTEPVILGEWVSLEPVRGDGKKRRGAFISRYIIRHIRRTGGKAILLVLVTALLLSVAGQLIIMDASYNKIFEETEIISNYAGYLNLKYVNELITSGYVKDVFYKEDTSAEINGTVCRTYVTSNPDKCMNETLDITWLEGYDISSMMQLEERVVVVGEAIANRLELVPGDTVRIAAAFVYQNIYDNYFFKYSREFGDPPKRYVDEQYNPEYDVWYNGFNEKYGANIDAEYAADTDEFKVIGIATARTHSPDLSIFINGTLELNILYGKLAILDIIEATLADNWKAEEYRAFGEELAAANLKGEIAFVMDTSKLDNVRNNIKLMDTLYPIIVTAILVIGAFLCGILIVQTSKDIAIMRVLGTSKRTVRGIMIIEHTALCLVGIIIAALILALRQVTQAVMNDMLAVCAMYFAAALIATVISSAAATRKNVLELLQTKE
ncbi:MAG: ABC transporter permease [Oscillospiraceae bacterium]|nr:ABC transporter permease [Oscillospiraceae bacterium]